jgi:predicted phosphodiesterase
VVVDYLTVSLLKKIYGDNSIDKLRDVLRSSMSGFIDADDLDDMWDISVYQVYSESLSKQADASAVLDASIRSAFAEVIEFSPDFIINTGDLVLESNNGSAEAIDRWFEYYVSITGNADITFYNTIGNNEIAGTQRAEFTSDDPQFGKYFFQQYFGPTHYSFDYGGFHFIALDTHSPDPKEDNADYWNFGKMTAEISEWVRRDLETYQDKTLVVLNHEPFHFDPLWPLENNGLVADDEGMFAEFGVDYVLSGHTHFKSYMQIDGVHHITTGALSGLRWVLPPSIHPRGYRFFYAKQNSLFSFWKPAAEAVLALAEPQPVDKHLRVIAIVNATEAIEKIEVSHGVQKLTIERWGDYFVQIELPDDLTEGDQPLTVQVITTSYRGVRLIRDLEL